MRDRKFRNNEETSIKLHDIYRVPAALLSIYHKVNLTNYTRKILIYIYILIKLSLKSIIIDWLQRMTNSRVLTLQGQWEVLREWTGNSYTTFYVKRRIFKNRACFIKTKTKDCIPLYESSFLVGWIRGCRVNFVLKKINTRRENHW